MSNNFCADLVQLRTTIKYHVIEIINIKRHENVTVYFGYMYLCTRFRRKLDYHASKDYHLQTFRACRVLYIFPTKNLIEKICQVLTHSMHKVTH